MAMTEVWMPSPNYSSRGGSPITKVVLHTTEGAMKIRDLGNYFANAGVQASSHFGADNYEPGVVGAYVYESNKAWTQGDANPWCVSMELCAYASWSRDTWLGSKGVLVQNAAEWVGWMCGKYGIPIKSLSASEATNTSIKGVCDHVDFGSWGGGHHDCGSGFPMDKVIEWAKGGGGSAPSTPGGIHVSSSVFDSNGGHHLAGVTTDGRVQYRPPGKGWAVVDPGSNAKSGADIAYNGATDRLVISYTNQNGEFCTYDKPVDGGSWGWATKGGGSFR